MTRRPLYRQKNARPYRRPTMEQMRELMLRRAAALKLKPVVVAVRNAIRMGVYG